MRKRWIYDGEGNAVEITEDGYAHLHHIMPEIEPYRSMVDGSIIESRAKHNEHLKRHGYRQIDPSEVAPEKIANYKHEIPDVAPQQRKELIRSQVDAMTHKEFRAAIQRDIDRVKWNSNY